MGLFIWRLLSHTATFFAYLLPLQLVGAVILLFVVPFLSPDNLRLPYILRWFDSADSYIGRDTSVYAAVCKSGWWNRYTWLAWRNPINYFGYKHNGLNWEGREIYSKFDPKETSVGDASQDHPGFRHIEVMKPVVQDNQISYITYFEYYWIYQYPFAKKVCFRFRLGWKIKDTDNPKGTTSQWVYVISPWKRYSGK